LGENHIEIKRDKLYEGQVGGQNFRGKVQNNQREQGLERDSNIIDVDRRRERIGYAMYIKNGTI